MSALSLTPGFHSISEEAYHADPAITPSLSSGVLSKIVLGTLADAREAHPRLNPAYESADSTKFDLGSVAHTLLLGKGQDIAVIDAEDWRTKAAKEARDEAIKQNKQPCLLSTYETAECMVATARDQLSADPANRDAFNPRMGVPEQVAIAALDTLSGPILCRAMVDWQQNVVPTGNEHALIVYDYKTFAPGADPENFVRYLFREARDVQDPFYRMILAKLLMLDPQRDIAFRFVVQSPKPPYLLSVIELDMQAAEFAFERAAWGMQQWAAANRDNAWPGYLPRTHYVSPPNYELHRWAEKMNAGELAGALDARDAALEAEEMTDD